MNKNYYFTEFVSGKAKTDLENDLMKLGLRYQSPERGGGDVKEIAKQIIAWINVHDFWVGFFASLAASRTEKILSAMYKWFVSHKTDLDKNVEYRAKIFVYHRNGSIDLELPINKKYSKKDISNLIKQLHKK